MFYNGCFFKTPNILLDVIFRFRLLKARRGVEEVRRNPKNGPTFGVTAAQFENVRHIALLREVRVLELLALAAEHVDQLPATAEHRLGDAFVTRFL